ncbi:restriction endonuclease subunit S [Leuconostoc lactis]|uniref:restriction endonuclease subunit S n=1 Tax=Leuconostoc lactis TaxID=1246 RepID=UPI003B281F38
MAKIDDSVKKKVPELRFKGFTDDWEERKLNEVSDIYDGTHQTPKYQDNGVMFLSVENIKTLTSNKFISREAFEDEFKIRPQRGDVLMTRIGDIGTANVVETDEDLAYYVSLALFKSEELNPYFLQASIYAPFVQDQIWKRTLHIAFPKKINKNEIGQVPINVPTLPEQTKIGSFFKQLDDLITLHQRKLDLLKEQKKGYLQKMFPKNGEKVPELRFAGFTDDWEERKLKELGDIQTGNTPPTSDSDNYSLDGVLWVTPTDIKSLVISNTAKKLSQVGVTKARIAKAGSILVTSIASIGKNTLLRMDAGFNQQINSLTPTSENDSYFLLTQSEKWSEKMKQTAASATMQIVNKTDFSNISTYVPVHKEEQEKIGSFFKQLDDIIALHQFKLDLLKEQKKGFLQKMFV